MKLRVVVFVALIVLVPGAALLRSQPDSIVVRWDNGIGHSTWDLALKAKGRQQMLSIWKDIGSDLKTEQNILAGTYVKGGYSAGYFLRWSPKAFVLIPYFDQNLITDFSYGEVAFVDSSRIAFSPVRDLKGGRSLAKTPREWAAIWNYLVPVESIKDFGQFHAGLGIFNEFNGDCCEFAPDFLAQKIDARASEPYSPVPIRYVHFIQRPIEGHITFVGRKRRVKDWGYEGKLYSHWIEKAVLIPVRVDLGGDRRVKKNMLFRLVEGPNFAQYLQITKVGSRTSMGHVVREIFGDGKETYRDNFEGPEKPLPPIRVGMKVTTRPWLSQSN